MISSSQKLNKKKLYHIYIKTNKIWSLKFFWILLGATNLLIIVSHKGFRNYFISLAHTLSLSHRIKYISSPGSKLKLLTPATRMKAVRCELHLCCSDNSLDRLCQGYAERLYHWTWINLTLLCLYHVLILRAKI